MAMQVDESALRAAGVELVLVFGSQARETARRGSDVDVGVVFAASIDGDSDSMEGRETAVRAALSAGQPLDVVLLDMADPLLLREAAVDGRPVFEARPGAAEEFRLRAVKRFMDTAWLRAVESDALRRNYP